MEEEGEVAELQEEDAAFEDVMSDRWPDESDSAARPFVKGSINLVGPRCD